MARGFLLGLDIGTTRIKAVVVDAAGVEQASASVPTPFVSCGGAGAVAVPNSGAVAGGVEMEVSGLDRAVAAVIEALGPARERVAAVGVTGMAESGAPLREGRALAPVIAWNDGRGKETVASLEGRFGPALARWTGRRVRTVSSVAKLGWLVDHGLAAPDRWLGVPELVLFLLTGAEATEHSLAARSGAYHVTERRWLPEVIAHVIDHAVAPSASVQDGGSSDARSVGPGQTDRASDLAGSWRGSAGRVAAGLFPPVRRAGEAMGFVTGEAAAGYGLPEGIPVTIAGHDHLAAAAGLGGRADDLFNSVGTAETLVRRFDAVPDVERALELGLTVTLWPGGAAWGVLASAARAGLVIGALSAHLGTDPTVLDVEAAAARGVVQRAPVETGSGAGREGVVGAAPVVARRAPVDLGQGIEVPDGPAVEMWTATLEALARRTAVAAGRIAALAGPPGRLVVFGGGSRSRAWLQAKATALGLPVVACPVPEAAARGAALAAGVATGWWPTAAAGPTPSGPA